MVPPPLSQLFLNCSLDEEQTQSEIAHLKAEIAQSELVVAADDLEPSNDRNSVGALRARPDPTYYSGLRGESSRPVALPPPHK